MARKPKHTKAKKPAPSTNGPSKGKESTQFKPGNPGGPGNPLGKQVAQLRAALVAAITPDDIQAIVKSLIREAKAGNVIAIKEVLDRSVGKSAQPVEVSGTVQLAPLFPSKAHADGI